MNERNVAASVRARLLNHARETRQDFNQILTRFAIERFFRTLKHRWPYFKSLPNIEGVLEAKEKFIEMESF